MRRPCLFGWLNHQSTVERAERFIHGFIKGSLVGLQINRRLCMLFSVRPFHRFYSVMYPNCLSLGRPPYPPHSSVNEPHKSFVTPVSSDAHSQIFTSLK